MMIHLKNIKLLQQPNNQTKNQEKLLNQQSWCVHFVEGQLQVGAGRPGSHSKVSGNLGDRQSSLCKHSEGGKKTKNAKNCLGCITAQKYKQHQRLLSPRRTCCGIQGLYHRCCECVYVSIVNSLAKSLENPGLMNIHQTLYISLVW